MEGFDTVVCSSSSQGDASSASQMLLRKDKPDEFQTWTYTEIPVTK